MIPSSRELARAWLTAPIRSFRSSVEIGGWSMIDGDGMVFPLLAMVSRGTAGRAFSVTTGTVPVRRLPDRSCDRKWPGL